VNDDLVKIGIVAAIMGALLLGGLVLRYRTAAPEVPEVSEETETSVLPLPSLEMLEPTYSEKAVYADCGIRISFEIFYTSSGEVESKLAFWLNNATGDVIAVDWNRCSMQLPSGDTVNIVHEEQVGIFKTAISPPTAIAPGSDLFSTVFPVSELDWTAEEWIVSSNVLDQGPFKFVLALEAAGDIQYVPFRFIIR